MASGVVYKGVRNNMPNAKGLFAGTKFWFSSTVPQRSRFIEDVKANGGEVVPLEKQADICLYDHARKNPPPGMYSYRYVEHSIRNGQLEDLEAHRIGDFDTRAARPVGSITLASKGSKAPFTEADDQMLWDWVKPFEGMRGSAGNALYQDLERVNPRHTYQSWRDRWLKYVKFQKRTLTPKAGQQQQDPAPTRSRLSTTTSVAKPTVVRVGRAAASPSLVVEVPLEGSPRRKRGRPPKTPQVQSVDRPMVVPVEDTPRRKPGRPLKTLLRSSDEEEAHTVPKQSQRPTRSACEQNAEKPGLRKTLTSTSKNTVESRKFSNDARPSQPSPEKNQMAEPQFEVSRQGANEESDAVGKNAQQFHPGCNVQAQSSTVSKTDYSRGRPMPPRKRTLARDNSQEQDSSLDVDVATRRAHALSQITGIKQQSDWHVREVAVTQPTKRRKLSVTEGTALEIQSTPEHAQESDSLEEFQGTPTPRAQKRLHQNLQNTFSPSFVARFESGRDLANVSTSPEQDFERNITVEPATYTSPISVHLVGDHDPAVTISSSTSNRNAETGISSSPTPEFETAPDFSQVQGDVSVDGDQARFETAAESPAAVKASIPNTQVLFAAPIQGGEEPLDLGLPEPEGGWDVIEPDLAIANDDRAIAAAPDSPSLSTGSAQSLDLDSWVALRAGEGHDIHLLLTAAEATNMHSKLADMVYESLERGQGVPKYVRGVWTKEDDEVLMGTDARAIQKLGEKHGQRSVDERFECLAVWRGQ